MTTALAPFAVGESYGCVPSADGAIVKESGKSPGLVHQVETSRYSLMGEAGAGFPKGLWDTRGLLREWLCYNFYCIAARACARWTGEGWISGSS